MTLEQAVSSAEFILIEGDRGSGKNMLSTYFASSSGLKNSVTIVAIPMETYYKKYEICKKMMSVNKFDFDNVFLFDDEWKQTKKQYSLDFILNDIEKLLDTTGAQFLYIQRVDLLFDMMDQLGSFEVLTNIARLVLSRKVKTIISLLKPSDNYLSIHDALLNYADLTLFIAHDNEQKGRLVEVISSFYPVEQTSCRFVYQDGAFFLMEKQQLHTKNHDVFPLPTVEVLKTMPPILPTQNNDFNLVVVTPSNKIYGWSEYLFGNLARVSLRRFRELSELSTEIWEQLDMIVYEAESMDVVCRFYEEAANASPQSKKIGILTKSFVRAEDKVKAHQLGAAELFGKNIRVLDYVLELEKSISTPFYSESIQRRLEAITVESSDNFVDMVESSLRVRRIFSVFIFGYTSPFSENERLETIFREEDIAYLDEENHKLYLLFFNAQAEDHAILWKKLLSIKEDIVYESAIEAPDLFSGKEVLFEHSFEMAS